MRIDLLSVIDICISGFSTQMLVSRSNKHRGQLAEVEEWKSNCFFRIKRNCSFREAKKIARIIEVCISYQFYNRFLNVVYFQSNESKTEVLCLRELQDWASRVQLYFQCFKGIIYGLYATRFDCLFLPKCIYQSNTFIERL